MFANMGGGHTAGISTYNYEVAVKMLNNLQSNSAYTQSVKSSEINSLEDSKKYLQRSGITWDQMDSLSVIHVAGTKGKGSTCAFTEAILRAHGYSTGFFSSPHLVTVRERFRINGQPISEANFTHYFWKVYKALDMRKEHEKDMPQYFKFLTIMMFHVFIGENVDVSIIEVGIGGELDSTNVIRKPICTGITNLHFDHENLLGNTIEEIAYQKAGIFKPGAMAFTVPQTNKAMQVLKDRAMEKKCELRIVPDLRDYPWQKSCPTLSTYSTVQNYNASLAIKLASYWIASFLCEKEHTPILKQCNMSILKAEQMSTYLAQSKNFEALSLQEDLIQSSAFLTNIARAVSTCKWPGRMQVLHGKVADVFLDGAHTVESINSCVSWFDEATKSSNGMRFLIFNMTGNRNPQTFLNILRKISFDHVYFVPNISGVISRVDQENYQIRTEEQMLRCKKHQDIWGEGSTVAENVTQVFNVIMTKTKTTTEKNKILITGSLYLVGAALTILDPELTMKTHI